MSGSLYKLAVILVNQRNEIRYVVSVLLFNNEIHLYTDQVQ